MRQDITFRRNASDNRFVSFWKKNVERKVELDLNVL